MGGMYKGILIIMIALLAGAGIAALFDAQVRGINVSQTLVRFYLLAIPAALISFTIVMFLHRVKSLAISGLILSLLWLVFKWLG